MKRTRRVEVITYSRRVTLNEDDSAATDDAPGPRADKFVLDVLEGIKPIQQPLTPD